jgi:glycosyltransferase involved in cell wall biosynthesis
MDVLIGYTSFNRLAYTQATLPALLRWGRGRQGVALAVVDDCSQDGSAEWLAEAFAEEKEHPDSIWKRGLILQRQRRGNGRNSNLMWRMTEGDYVKLDNDVVILRDDWLDVLVDYAQRLPNVGIVAHNCEIRLHEAFPERNVAGLRVSVPVRTRNGISIVAGACALIPAATRQRCGRWNTEEPRQGFNRGLDRVYASKVHLAGLIEYYTTDQKAVYATCLQGGETAEYAAERERLKLGLVHWARRTIRDYESGARPLNDVQ